MSASARPSTIPGDDDAGDVDGGEDDGGDGDGGNDVDDVDEFGYDDGQSAMIVRRKSPKTDKVYIFLTFTKERAAV